MRKLRDRRGETLTETLCSLLVLALAVALMASMIVASTRLDQKTDKIVAQLYQAVSKAEKPESAAGTGNISVEVGGNTATVPVTFSGDPEQVVSYRAESGGDAP